MHLADEPTGSVHITETHPENYISDILTWYQCHPPISQVDKTWSLTQLTSLVTLDGRQIVLATEETLE